MHINNCERFTSDLKDIEVIVEDEDQELILQLLFPISSENIVQTLMHMGDTLTMNEIGAPILVDGLQNVATSGMASTTG